jgi:hypothetical protein
VGDGDGGGGPRVDGGGGGGWDEDGGYPDEGPIDFTDNLLASPMPPGALDPADAPMIIVFGWDDCAFTGDHPGDGGAQDNGMNFIARTFGDIVNPDGSQGSVSFYQNGAYLPNSESGGPWGSETNLMLAAGQELLAAAARPPTARTASCARSPLGPPLDPTSHSTLIRPAGRSRIGTVASPRS